MTRFAACKKSGLVQGYPDGSFKPEAPVTHDQLAVYLARALAGGDDKVPTYTGSPSFKDVPKSDWAFKYIEYCKTQNVAVVGTGWYVPAAVLTRGDMAVFMARAIAPAADRPTLPNFTPPATPSFPDVPSSNPQYKYIEYCRSKGVVNGYPDGTYYPYGEVTRGELAVFVTRGFNLQP